MKRISLVPIIAMAFGIAFLALSGAAVSSTATRPQASGLRAVVAELTIDATAELTIEATAEPTTEATAEPTAEATHALYVPPFMKAWPTPAFSPTPTPTRTPPPSLKSKVSKVTLTLPTTLTTSTSWCTWGWCTLSPRLYQEPLKDGRTMIGWTDKNGVGHIGILSQSAAFDQTFSYTNRSVRGLVAHDDGTFAVLLWDPYSKVMWLSKRQANGSEIWAANVDGPLTSFSSSVGDSRLAYGQGRYAAYFAVQGDSGWPQGNMGDQLTYVSSDGIVLSEGWDWGCSHSLAELINYHPALDKFVPVCASDCYSSKGILLNIDQIVYPAAGDCAGLVSAQLGQIAQSESAWKLIFNGVTMSGYEGKGIGLATINDSFRSSYVWLTNTQGQYERDPVMARLGSSLNSDRYLVGWRTMNDGTHWLAVINGSGAFLAGPEEVSSAGILWGTRDDSFRTRPDGSVSWLQVDASTGVLRLFRFDGSGFVP